MTDQSNGSGTNVMWIIGGLLALGAIGALLTPVDNTPTTSTNTRVYDPNSTSEGDRRLVRDKMIQQGSKPDEAEAFTRELFQAEREHRRTNGLPE